MLLAGTVANLINTFDCTVLKRVILNLTKALAWMLKLVAINLSTVGLELSSKGSQVNVSGIHNHTEEMVV